MKTTIGIDLGTTFCALAYVDERGDPQAISLSEGDGVTMHSVVKVQDGEIVVGERAYNEWITNKEHVVRWVKRAMGDEKYRFHGLSAIEISAEILKEIKRRAEEELSFIDEAVVTCPAYFSALETENTLEAAKLAGLNVTEIVREPEAAALYHGIANLGEGEKCLICDLGGGTYDATVLSFENSKFQSLATNGDRRTGGHDWTEKLRSEVQEQFLDVFGFDPVEEPVSWTLLYEQCEKAKRDLSTRDEVSIPLEFDGTIHNVTVTREDFELSTESLIAKVVAFSEKAVEEAGVSWADLSQVLLVGGSSRLRRFKEAMTEVSGIEAEIVNKPDMAVAFGAAIIAHGEVRTARRPALVEKAKPGSLVEKSKGGLIAIEDVLQRSNQRNLGTRVMENENGEYQIVNSVPIIPRGSDVPTSKSRDHFQVPADGIPSIDVPVVEFSDGEKDRCERIHSYRFSLPPGAKKGDRVEVTFHYDKSRTITVDARYLKDNQYLNGDKAVLTAEDERKMIELASSGSGGKPRWVVFAIDISYSMSGTDIQAAKSAVIDVAGQLLDSNPSNQVGVVSFGSRAETVCHPTSDLSMIRSRVSVLDVDGSTAMDKGILEGMNLLKSAPPSVDRQLVLATDGLPDDEAEAISAARSAEGNGIELFAVSIAMDSDFLKEITPNEINVESSSSLGDAFSTFLRQS